MVLPACEQAALGAAAASSTTLLDFSLWATLGSGSPLQDFRRQHECDRLEDHIIIAGLPSHVHYGHSRSPAHPRCVLACIIWYTLVNPSRLLAQIYRLFQASSSASSISMASRLLQWTQHPSAETTGLTAALRHQSPHWSRSCRVRAHSLQLFGPDACPGKQARAAQAQGTESVSL